MEFQLVLTIFYHQKLLSRESSFHHLASAFWHQTVCCHLEPHKEEVEEESNTDSQAAEHEDDP
jgi:hypothetical protein